MNGKFACPGMRASQCVPPCVCALQLQQLALHFAVCTMRLHLNPQRIDSVSFWPALDSRVETAMTASEEQRRQGGLEASSNCSWNNLNSGPRLGPKPQNHSWIASWQPQQQQQQSLRLALVIVQISWPHRLRAKGAWQVRNTPEAIAVTAVELTPAMPILSPPLHVARLLVAATFLLPPHPVE